MGALLKVKSDKDGGLVQNGKQIKSTANLPIIVATELACSMFACELTMGRNKS